MHNDKSPEANDTSSMPRLVFQVSKAMAMWLMEPIVLFMIDSELILVVIRMA